MIWTRFEFLYIAPSAYNCFVSIRKSELKANYRLAKLRFPQELLRVSDVLCSFEWKFTDALSSYIFYVIRGQMNQMKGTKLRSEICEVIMSQIFARIRGDGFCWRRYDIVC